MRVWEVQPEFLIIITHKNPKKQHISIIFAFPFIFHGLAFDNFAPIFQNSYGQLSFPQRVQIYKVFPLNLNSLKSGECL